MTAPSKLAAWARLLRSALNHNAKYYGLEDVVVLDDIDGRELAALLEAADGLRAAAIAAMAAMEDTLASCENQHHPRRDQNHGADCPPVARFDAARTRLRAALAALEDKP